MARVMARSLRRMQNTPANLRPIVSSPFLLIAHLYFLATAWSILVPAQAILYDEESPLRYAYFEQGESEYFQLLERMKGSSFSMSQKSHLRLQHARDNQPSSIQPETHHDKRGLMSSPQIFSVKCRMTMVDFLYADFGSELTGHAELVGCIPLEFASQRELDLVLTMEIPKHIYQTYRHGIRTGTVLLQWDGVSLSDDQEHLIVHEEGVTEIFPLDGSNSDPANNRNLQQRIAPPPTIGSMSVFIVRVSSSDSSPNMTLAELQDRLFHPTLPNFPSQFRSCSMEQLEWTLAGGADIVVDVPIGNFTTGMGIVTLAESYLRQAMQVSSLAELADRLLFCVAPGTSMGWIASASINHWRAIFNNEWCSSLSGTMHELGHTIGLLHSGEEDNKYGDQTGYMGYGSVSDLGPRKCFNGYQSWQLGWYKSRQKMLDSFYEPGMYALVGFVDYQWTLNNEYVILAIDDTFFLVYNLAASFNIDTSEKRDEVTITIPIDSGTLTVAGLSAGANYTVPNYRDTGLPLIIEACSMRSATEVIGNAMYVAVGLGRSYCIDPDAIDANDSTVPPTAPQCMARHDRCISHDDCCDSLRCFGPDFQKVCSSCKPEFSECEQDVDCCAGLSCDAGVCFSDIEDDPLGLSPINGTTFNFGSGGEPLQCQQLLMSCASHSECCDDLRCITMLHPKCRQCRIQNNRCVEDMDCCDGLRCSESETCQPFLEVEPDSLDEGTAVPTPP